MRIKKKRPDVSQSAGDPLHLVVFADLALHAEDVSGLLQLLDGFGVSGSQLTEGVRSLLHLLQEAQVSVLLGLLFL